MEVLMALTLTAMGVYFFKSTDLPKDLKERSAQFQSETSQISTSNKSIKITIPSASTKTVSLDKNLDAKLAEMKLQKKIKEIQVLNQEIDQLTLTITSLEQELKANNDRNNEIQSLIDSHLLGLQLLQEQLTKLS